VAHIFGLVTVKWRREKSLYPVGILTVSKPGIGIGKLMGFKMD
jgi:hypothetical protein